MLCTGLLHVVIQSAICPTQSYNQFLNGHVAVSRYIVFASLGLTRPYSMSLLFLAKQPNLCVIDSVAWTTV